MSSPPSDRRTILRQGLAATASLLVARSSLWDASVTGLAQGAERPWLAAALKAERWLAQSARRGDGGIAWPADPLKPGSISADLYTGMAGVVLFHLELHNATGDATALATARGGADYLLASIPSEPTTQAMGLYTGLAGTAVVLSHAWRATGEERYRAGVRRVLGLLAGAATPVGAGVEWNESTDIISGSAGIGLALLGLAGDGEENEARELAIAAGSRLVERADRAGDGLTWLISPRMPRNYPNFSHGTAGVSFFLARLYGATGRREFLDAALSGERWLRGITIATPAGGRMIHHSTPGNEQLFYLSWCHGPAGTSRLYRELSRVTGDAAWRHAIPSLALATRDMKVPDRSPGFWNNVSQCCGNCGVTEFFVALYAHDGDARHLAFAEEVAHDTLRRATAEGDGWKWIQAEHRVRPELLVAQTGLMQGAAGIGLAFLHLDGARTGRKPLVRLPDDPWG